jgi:hypothetical protein
MTGSGLRHTRVLHNQNRPKNVEKPSFLARLGIAFAGALAGGLVKLLFLSMKHHVVRPSVAPTPRVQIEPAFDTELEQRRLDELTVHTDRRLREILEPSSTTRGFKDGGVRPSPNGVFEASTNDLTVQKLQRL